LSELLHCLPGEDSVTGRRRRRKEEGEEEKKRE
jgi:hypothetical protein